MSPLEFEALRKPDEIMRDALVAELRSLNAHLTQAEQDFVPKCFKPGVTKLEDCSIEWLRDMVNLYHRTIRKHVEPTP